MKTTRGVAMMNDAEWIESLKKISSASEMLRIIVDNEQYFGYDPYYSDLRTAMLDRAADIIKAEGY